MANQANLEATLAAVEANQDHWDQSRWHCGTSHCFAGFAEMLRLDRDPCSVVEPKECSPQPFGQPGLIDEQATREWLGLNERQWPMLVASDNSLDDLRRMVKEGVPEYVPIYDDDDDWDDDWELDDEYEDDWDDDEDDFDDDEDDWL